MIKIGDYNKLKMIRKSDLGYMLSDGSTDVLMHFKQAKEEINVGDEVNVFIYSDKNKRPTATQDEVFATISDAGFVRVVEVLSGVGVFVNNNTPKDILISKDYLPYDESKWPMVDDYLIIRLKLKGDILTGKPLNRFDIISLRSEVKYADFELVDGYVCRINEKGIGIITLDRVHVFVPYTQLRGSYRLGQAITVTITKSIDGECYGTLNAKKEDMIDSDRELILKYLEDHHGVMKVTAKSSAEEIEKLLKMSRKAFKRAYGGLYKDRLIEFDENRTYLVKYRGNQE